MKNKKKWKTIVENNWVWHLKRMLNTLLNANGKVIWFASVSSGDYRETVIAYRRRELRITLQCGNRADVRGQKKKGSTIRFEPGATMRFGYRPLRKTILPTTNFMLAFSKLTLTLLRNRIKGNLTPLKIQIFNFQFIFNSKYLQLQIF